MRTPTPSLVATSTDLGRTWNWPKHIPCAVTMPLSWKVGAATGQSSPRVVGTVAFVTDLYDALPPP